MLLNILFYFFGLGTEKKFSKCGRKSFYFAAKTLGRFKKDFNKKIVK